MRISQKIFNDLYNKLKNDKINFSNCHVILEILNPKKDYIKFGFNLHLENTLTTENNKILFNINDGYCIKIFCRHNVTEDICRVSLSQHDDIIDVFSLNNFYIEFPGGNISSSWTPPIEVIFSKEKSNKRNKILTGIETFKLFDELKEYDGQIGTFKIIYFDEHIGDSEKFLGDNSELSPKITQFQIKGVIKREDVGILIKNTDEVYVLIYFNCGLAVPIVEGYQTGHKEKILHSITYDFYNI